MALSESDLGYAAGILDGEGSIGIVHKRPKGSVQRYHHLVVGVNNTDRRMVMWLKERFGGHVGGWRSRRLGWSGAFSWTVSHQKAETFLRAVQPYSIIKAEQIALALALRATRQNYGRWGGLSDEVIAERAVLRASLIRLHHPVEVARVAT